MTTTLSPEQLDVINDLVAYYTSDSPQQYITLCGYAGTGKTTVLSHFLSSLSDDSRSTIFVVAPTGKAASVLRSKGIDAMTLHQLIYKCVSLKPLTFERRTRIPEASLLIIDEASMLDSTMLADILSFNIPTVFVGDSFQLPPINRDPKLLLNPDLLLSTIHRSESKIIQLASDIRLTKTPLAVLCRKYDCVSPTLTALRAITNHENTQIICGYNRTKDKINSMFAKNVVDPLPTIGDKLICLKNNHELGMSNGEIFFVENVYDDDRLVLRDSLGETFEVKYDQPTFLSKKLPSRPSRERVYLDYGYAITCHKAQGSEFDHVLCFNEAFGDEPNRWAYTAVTRARETFTLLL